MTTAADPFAGFGSAPSGPYKTGVAVTPSDADELAQVASALYIGGTGDVAVVMVDGTSITLKSVPTGDVLPLRVRQVKATGTTATNIVALT